MRDYRINLFGLNEIFTAQLTRLVWNILINIILILLLQKKSCNNNSKLIKIIGTIIKKENVKLSFWNDNFVSSDIMHILKKAKIYLQRREKLKSKIFEEEKTGKDRKAITKHNSDKNKSQCSYIIILKKYPFTKFRATFIVFFVFCC